MSPSFARTHEWLARLTAMREDPGSNHTADSYVIIATAAAIYSLGHGLRTFTAVPGRFSLPPFAGR